MCKGVVELAKELVIYDVVKYIGGLLGWDMVDILDRGTYNPLHRLFLQDDDDDDDDDLIDLTVEDSNV